MVIPANLDPRSLPPEFLAALGGGNPQPAAMANAGISRPMVQTPPRPGSPGFDGPSEDPQLREMQFIEQQTAALEQENMGLGDLQSPVAPGFAPDQGPMQAPPGQDPVIAQLMQRVMEGGPLTNERAKNRSRKPKKEEIEALANRDMYRWAETIHRFAEDVALFRQHSSSTPKSFRHDREERIKSAEFSILVNKLSNMFAGTGVVYDVPYDNLKEEKSSQIIEDALYYLRKRAKRAYGYAGGNLQRDEFFYMFLYGRYVKRILPDLRDPDYPFREALMDPATCFPTWGDEKTGLVRMVRRYTTTVGKVISTFGEGVPNLEKKLAKKLGYDEWSPTADFYHEEGEMIEYHDKSWYYCSFKGMDVVPVTAHDFGVVPYVYIMPTGEPQSMSTPGGKYFGYSSEYAMDIPYIMGTEQDLAQKGVSVYHYLKNTHKTKEKLMTLLYNEVEKATDPSTITYTAPHLAGKEPPPLDTKRGGNNQRLLNFQQVEGVPTSPRPTDFSPLFMTIQDEMIQGSLPPGAFGAEQGPNTTASGVTAMVQQAYDLVTPYIEAWQNGQAQEAQIKLDLYMQHISPSLTLRVPEHDARGQGTGEIHDLSPDDIRAVGTYVDVRMAGLNLQNEAQQIAAMGQAVSNGFYSRRHAMNKLNVENPDKMFTEIIGEQAMQHPEMMENFIIPEGFMSQGMEDFARLWMELVVAPKLAQMSMTGQMPGQDPPSPEGQGSQAVPAPEGPTGAPGGPPPGMGRGPATPETGGMI